MAKCQTTLYLDLSMKHFVKEIRYILTAPELLKQPDSLIERINPSAGQKSISVPGSTERRNEIPLEIRNAQLEKRREQFLMDHSE